MKEAVLGNFRIWKKGSGRKGRDIVFLNGVAEDFSEICMIRESLTSLFLKKRKTTASLEQTFASFKTETHLHFWCHISFTTLNRRFGYLLVPKVRDLQRCEGFHPSLGNFRSTHLTQKKLQSYRQQEYWTEALLV